MHSLRDTNPAAFARYLRAKTAEPCAANAALIAAAPELLAALREARVMVHAMTGDAPASAPWNALLPRIDAAIARATEEA